MSGSGTWVVTSKKDPRWNGSGRSGFVGDFMMPEEAKAYIAEKEKTLGEHPDDLNWSYMKD